MQESVTTEHFRCCFVRYELHSDRIGARRTHFQVKRISFSSSSLTFTQSIDDSPHKLVFLHFQFLSSSQKAFNATPRIATENPSDSAADSNHRSSYRRNASACIVPLSEIASKRAFRMAYDPCFPL